MVGYRVLTTAVRTARRVSIAEWFLYAALGVAVTWPLASSMTGAIPLGTGENATVPLLNLWTVWWNADRAARLFDDYWQAPIFHPVENVFAFSEPQPAMGVVAPLVWWTGKTALAYNAYLLLALSLNGWSTFRLLRRWQFHWGPAFFGGAMTELLPFVHWQLHVLQLVPLFGVIWTIHALDRFAERPGIGHSLLLGAAFGSTYLLCNHYGLFFSILLLAAGGWLLGRRLGQPATWLALLPGIALALLAILPFGLVQRNVMQQHGWQRDPALARSLSAEAGDYTVPAWPQLVSLGHLSSPDRSRFWKLAPGNLKIGMAVFGVIAGLLMRCRRGRTAYCLTLLVTAFVLSMGPKFTVGDFCPYDWLRAGYPGFAQVRNVFRFAVFVQLATVLLAAIGLQTIWQWTAGHRQPPHPPRCCSAPSSQGRESLTIYPSPSGRGAGGEGRRCALSTKWNSLLVGSVLVLAGIGLTVEIWPARSRLFHLPASSANQGWIRWLEDHTAPEAVLACIPFPEGRSAEAYEPATKWMYWQTRHRRRLVGGYSGFFPESFLRLKKAMQNFPDRNSLRRLAERNVDYCVVKHSADLAKKLDRFEDRLEPVFHDQNADITIYALSESAGHRR